MPIRILISDDHTLVRESWAFRLNADSRFVVVAQCGNGHEAVRLAEEMKPDVILMDVNLPGLNGIEATKMIRKLSPNSAILGLSFYSLPAISSKMMAAGAMGYITKNSESEEMFIAIIQVHNKKKYICNNIKDSLALNFLDPSDEDKAVATISNRELEVIEHIRHGFTSREIAEILHISTKTVEVHRYNILKKLGLKNSVALIDLLNRNGLFYETQL